MALTKRIYLPSGISTNYHRVVSVNTITNQQNIIEVASYTSKQKRLDELAWYEAQQTPEAVEVEPMDVFIETTFYNVNYDQAMTIDAAYEYLKTLPEFSDSTDANINEAE